MALRNGAVVTFSAGYPPSTYTVHGTLGTGAFGSVYLVADRNGGSHGDLYALKVVRHVGLSGSAVEKQMRIDEIKSKWDSLRKLDHPNLTVYRRTEFIDSLNPLEAPTAYLLIEYCSMGNLEGYLRDKEHHLILPEVRSFSEQILKGLDYLHINGTIHTDLKPANIVLSPDPTQTNGSPVLKITDFDDHIKLVQANTQTDDVSFAKGTILFMSPEMISARQADSKVGRKTDIWSFGCVVIEMIRGKEPFQFVKEFVDTRAAVDDVFVVQPDSASHAITMFVADGGKPKIPQDLPTNLQKFLKKCFRRDPKQRVSAVELLNHAWIKFLDMPENFARPEKVQIQDAPAVATSEKINQFHLSRKSEKIPVIPPYRQDEMQWSRLLNCAARVMMHHDTLFPAHLYETELLKAPKICYPGEPFRDEFRHLLLKLLENNRSAVNDSSMALSAATDAVAKLSTGTSLSSVVQDPNTMSNILGSVFNWAASEVLTLPRSSALISQVLPPIGTSLVEVSQWMNTYLSSHDPYEYFVKTNACWEDVQMYLDKHEPVIVQTIPYYVKTHNALKSWTTLTGLKDVCPVNIPSVGGLILRGYHQNNGITEELYYTDHDGKNQSMPFCEFNDIWSREPIDAVVLQFFETAKCLPKTMVARRAKVHWKLMW